MELMIPKAPEPRPPMNEAPHGLWSDDELDAEDLINLIPTVDERPPSPINDDRSATAQLVDAHGEHRAAGHDAHVPHGGAQLVQRRV